METISAEGYESPAMATLDDMIKERGPLPCGEAAILIRNAALELGRWHETSGVHGDINPAVLVVGDHHAITLRDSLPHGGRDRVLGTTDFLAPEQAMSGEPDKRSDIYSLGCTFYFALAGRPPFQGTLAERLLGHQVKEPVPLESLRPDVPTSLAKICRTMMAKLPDERFPSAGAIAVDLNDWIKHQSG